MYGLVISQCLVIYQLLTTWISIYVLVIDQYLMLYISCSTSYVLVMEQSVNSHCLVVVLVMYQFGIGYS